MEVNEAHVADTPNLPPPDEDSVSVSLQRLIASGKDLAQAELAWAKLKGLGIAAILGRGLAFGAVAALFLLAFLALLLVAAVIALAPVVGWLAATLIMSAVTLLIALIAALLAKRSFGELAGEHKP